MISRDVKFLELDNGSYEQQISSKSEPKQITLPPLENDEQLNPDERPVMQDGDAPMQTIQEEQVLRRSQRSNQGVMSRFLQENYVFTANGNMADPATYDEAMNDSDADEWRAAMQEEYDALMKNVTWTLVDAR